MTLPVDKPTREKLEALQIVHDGDPSWTGKSWNLRLSKDVGMNLINKINDFLHEKFVPKNKWVRFSAPVTGFVVGISFAVIWNYNRVSICQTLGIGEVLFYTLGKVGVGVIGALVGTATLLFLQFVVFKKKKRK